MLLAPLTENLLVLLTYDETRAKLVRGAVSVELFGGPYRPIATCIYAYLDRYGKPPGDHLPDLLADKLDANKNKNEARLYNDIVIAIHDAKAGVNAEYIMAQLELFVRRQSLRAASIDIVKALQRDTEESLEEAERLIGEARRVNLNTFDPGTRLSDRKKALAFLDVQEDTFPIGVPELDKRGFGPVRKGLWLYISDTKTGKSWMLGQLAKACLLQQRKVLHISLEMPEARVSQRYFQSLFGMAKRSEPVEVTRLATTANGELKLEFGKVAPVIALDDAAIRKHLVERIDKWANRLLDNIIVKDFPSKSLTLSQLATYLDTLEVTERFVPDLLLLDYPDLMKLGDREPRFELDELYQSLRGLAGQRNLALAVVSQSHRQASKAKLVGRENVAEAYSKVQHADVAVTYSQTPQERKLKLARLHVTAGRYDEDRITVVISQNYAMGRFVVDSALMTKGYFDQLPEEE